MFYILNAPVLLLMCLLSLSMCDILVYVLFKNVDYTLIILYYILCLTLFLQSIIVNESFAQLVFPWLNKTFFFLALSVPQHM